MTPALITIASEGRIAERSAYSVGELELVGREPLELFIPSEGGEGELSWSKLPAVEARRGAARTLRDIAAVLGEELPDASPFDVDMDEVEKVFAGPPGSTRWAPLFEHIQRFERQRVADCEREGLRRRWRKRLLALSGVTVWFFGAITVVATFLPVGWKLTAACGAVGAISQQPLARYVVRGLRADLRLGRVLRRLRTARDVLLYDGRRIYLAATDEPAPTCCRLGNER